MSQHKFSRWLDDVQDEEAGFEDDGDDFAYYLPAWANAAVDSVDAALDRTEDALAARQAQWTPWAAKKYERTMETTGAAARRVRAVALLMGTSLAMFALAFALGLPTLALRPQKFALAFTLGSVFFCAALATARGARASTRAVLAPRRLLWALAYVATLLATLWAACVRRSYVLAVAGSVVQVGGLAWAAAASLPGGGCGARLVLRKGCGLAAVACRPLCGALCGVVGHCFR